MVAVPGHRRCNGALDLVVGRFVVEREECVRREPQSPRQRDGCPPTRAFVAAFEPADGLAGDTRTPTEFALAPVSVKARGGERVSCRTRTVSCER